MLCFCCINMNNSTLKYVWKLFYLWKTPEKHFLKFFFNYLRIPSRIKFWPFINNIFHHWQRHFTFTVVPVNEPRKTGTILKYVTLKWKIFNSPPVIRGLAMPITLLVTFSQAPFKRNVLYGRQRRNFKIETGDLLSSPYSFNRAGDLPNRQDFVILIYLRHFSSTGSIDLKRWMD